MAAAMRFGRGTSWGGDNDAATTRWATDTASSTGSTMYAPSVSDATAAAVTLARGERRWADASELLEVWVHAGRQFANDRGATCRSGSTSPMKRPARLLFSRSKSNVGGADLSAEDAGSSLRAPSAGSAQLMQRVPKLQKLLSKLNPPERAVYVTAVNKKNEHGKVQARLLAMTSSAVYNVSLDGTKLKRRIPLEEIASVTLDQATGAFVLHVPREYDYILTAAHSGLSLAADGSSKEHALQEYLQTERAGSAADFAAHVIVALKSLYGDWQNGAEQLAVRTFQSSGGHELTGQVQTKRRAQEKNDLYGDDDDDDDDEQEFGSI